VAARVAAPTPGEDEVFRLEDYWIDVIDAETPFDEELDRYLRYLRSNGHSDADVKDARYALMLRVVSCLTLRCLGRSGHGESSSAPKDIGRNKISYVTG
jgi:hypothetical protein